MFDFLFKRSAGKPPSEAVLNKAQEPDSRANIAADKDAALVQADALARNEPAAAEFILQCDYADARFKAAHHIHSKPLLEQVVLAMRNTDRRVARLMQKRLDAILSNEKAERQAEECIRQAQRLSEEPKLMPNQVADLDRAWTAVADVALPLRESFDLVRVALRERLEAQATLQRAAIDVSTKLQKLTRAATEASHVFTPDRLLQSLDSLEQEMAQYCAHREVQTLPQHLFIEFAKQRDHFKHTLAAVEKRNDSIAAREAALAGWEAVSIAELKEDVLRHAWRALPAPADGDEVLDVRFNTLLARIAELRKPKMRASNGVEQDQQQRFSEALDNMAKALENGALQVAADQDKALRAIDLKQVSPSEPQTTRLAKARSELHRLQDWARWGGNVSREELLKAAEEMPAKSHTVTELAKKVGSLRERWKSLDISAGPASKELWERFDGACTTAYAPAAAHFKQLADERHGNLEKARSIIAEIKQFAANANFADDGPDQVDWKAVAGFAARTAESWQRLGPIDRKEKKSSDAEFAKVMGLLSEPLAARRQIEIARREKLIAEASELNPADRRALDALRALQERWQEYAKSLPLERKDEQALWQRFRGACDAVFAKRKEAAHAADADRQLHLREKEALCASLEALEKEPSDILSKKMREATEAWSRIGPVPRAAEQQIEKRYQSALAALQKRIDDAQRLAKEAQIAALRDKLKLCHAAEELVMAESTPDDSELTRLQTGWQALPLLAAAWERALYARFDKASAALKTADRQHAALLQQNRAVLAHDVLRLEIIMGIDSPPELSRERLQLQVEVLQSSLKAGQKPLSQQEQLLHIVGLSALTDQQLVSRVERIAVRIDAFKS
jgi:exonuclease SbcC